MSKRIAAVAAAALSLAAAPSASAQQAEPAGVVRSNPVGFFGGVFLNGSSLKDNEGDAKQESGGGLTLQAGYAFRNKIAVFVDLAGASVDSEELDDSYSLAHVDLGARYQFSRPASAWTPFVEAAIGARGLRLSDLVIEDENGQTAEGDLDIRGTSFSIGGGTHYFFNPSVGLSAGLRWTTGKFDEAEFDGEKIDGDFFELDATTTRLNLGLVWFPRGR